MIEENCVPRGEDVDEKRVIEAEVCTGADSEKQEGVHDDEEKNEKPTLLEAYTAHIVAHSDWYLTKASVTSTLKETAKVVQKDGRKLPILL
jgi:hypothetical protein